MRAWVFGWVGVIAAAVAAPAEREAKEQRPAHYSDTWLQDGLRRLEAEAAPQPASAARARGPAPDLWREMVAQWTQPGAVLPGGVNATKGNNPAPETGRARANPFIAAADATAKDATAASSPVPAPTVAGRQTPPPSLAAPAQAPEGVTPPPGPFRPAETRDEVYFRQLPRF